MIRTGVGSLRPSGWRLPGLAPLPLDIAIEGVQVCARGAYVPHDADALAPAVQQPEVEYEIGLPGEGAETELFFSDLGHEYVTINADYTTQSTERHDDDAARLPPPPSPPCSRRCRTSASSTARPS